MKKILLSALLLGGLCAAAQERLTVQAPGVYPEGIAFNKANNMFYVSSVTTGTIGTVDMSGNYNELYKDPALKSTYGMEVDEAGKKLWVCVADANYSKYKSAATHKKMSKLLVLDLATGKKLSEINLSTLLPGKHFANDIAVDGKGNAYVTDSYAPVIYKIANGKASVFAKNDMWKSPDVGLNGIVYHPGGYLLVAHQTNGALYKVDMATPSKITKVKSKMFMNGADGLLLEDNNNLAVVVNKGTNKVFRVMSSDNWMNAEAIAATPAAAMLQQPTTLAQSGNSLYVLSSRMDELADKTRPPSKDFRIDQVMFMPLK